MKRKISVILLIAVLVFVAALAVACNDDKVVKEITVEGGMKSVYAVGEAFAGGRITVTYEDGTSESIDITAEMLSGFDTSTPGTKQVTVTYEGVSVTVEIVVETPASPAPEGSLELVEWQRIYLIGEALAGNLTIRTQSGELIPVTAAMISGFDTSTAGEKTVRITYNGLYIETVISVVAIPEGGDSEFAESEIDVDALLASLHRVTDHIGVSDADVQAMDETVTENIVPFMEKAGVTNAQIDDIVNLIFARENALADAIKGAVKVESPEALFNAVFTDNVVDSVLDILDYIGSATAPEGLMNVTTYFLMPLITPVADFGSDELIVTFFPGNLGDVDYDWYEYWSLNYDEIMDVADNSAYKDYFYEYYFGEGSGYNSIKEVFASASARLIAGNATELFEKIASYDRESIKDLAEFLKEAMPVFIEGDIGSLFSPGTGSKISIKDIVQQINFLGKFMNEAVLETVLGDDAVLAAAEIADNVICTLTEGYYSIDVSSVEGVRAALRMVFGLLEELEVGFVTDLYVDYDDMVKAKDEAEYEVKFGIFSVQIANFIAEGYNKLSDYDKMALKSFADWLDEAPGVSLLSGIVELLDGWVIKDVDSYSNEELVEAGRKITDAVSNKGVSERTNSMEIYRGDSRLPEYIPVGTSSADGLFDIRLSYNKENSGYWGSYITVEEFKEAGGTVNAEFDFSSKGFKTVTVTLSDVDYTFTESSGYYDDNGYWVPTEETYTIHFEGCTDSFEIYVYDDTSAADFEAVRDYNYMYAMVMEKNSSMENITASDMYFSTSYRHKETRNEIWARSGGFHGDWNISFEGIDTSRESGCLYLGKVILEHTVFGKAERPLFYYIYDSADSEKSLTNIEYYSYNSYPMSSSGASIVALKGAEFEDLGIYARKKYAYLVNGEEELEVKYKGSFNSDTLGTQQIKLYVEGYAQYAITVNVIVIEPEKAPDISIYLNNGYLVFPVGATSLDAAKLVPYTEGEEAYLSVRIYGSWYWEDNDTYGRYYYYDYNADFKTLAAAIEYIEKFGFEYKDKDIEGLDTTTPIYYGYMTLKFEYNQQEVNIGLFYRVEEKDATVA